VDFTAVSCGTHKRAKQAVEYNQGVLMIEPQYVLNADDVSRAFRILRKTEPELVKEFQKGMKTELAPMAKAIAQKYPTTPYLDNLGGYRRVTFNKIKNTIETKDNWVWSQVVGKVSITPGKARKGVGRNNVVALRMQYSGAIPWVTDFAKQNASLTPQGRALVRNIERKFPGWKNGGRIFYKEFMAHRTEAFDKAEKIMEKFIDGINKVI
jgi:hypothetical protein